MTCAKPVVTSCQSEMTVSDICKCINIASMMVMMTSFPDDKFKWPCILYALLKKQDLPRDMQKLVLRHVPATWRLSWQPILDSLSDGIQQMWSDPCSIQDVTGLKAWYFFQRNSGDIGKLNASLRQLPAPLVSQTACVLHGLCHFFRNVDFFRSFVPLAVILTLKTVLPSNSLTLSSLPSTETLILRFSLLPDPPGLTKLKC